MFSVDTCQFTFGPCHLKLNVFLFRRVYHLYSFIAPRPNWQGYFLEKEFNAPLFRPLDRMRTPLAGPRSEQQSVGEMTWTRSELTAVYWKHISHRRSPSTACPRTTTIPFSSMLRTGSIWTSESRRQSSFPFSQFLLHHGRDNPTLRLFTCCGSTKETVFKIHNIREYPCQFSRDAINE